MSVGDICIVIFAVYLGQALAEATVRIVKVVASRRARPCKHGNGFLERGDMVCGTCFKNLGPFHDART